MLSKALPSKVSSSFMSTTVQPSIFGFNRAKHKTACVSACFEQSIMIVIFPILAEHIQSGRIMSSFVYVLRLCGVSVFELS